MSRAVKSTVTEAQIKKLVTAVKAEYPSADITWSNMGGLLALYIDDVYVQFGADTRDPDINDTIELVLDYLAEHAADE